MRLWAKITLLALVVSSIVISTQPMRVSSYPYNLDSITESRAADHIAKNGNINYEENCWMSRNNHTRPTPIQNVLLAIISLLSQTDAIYIAQYFQACIFSISILGWSILAKKLTNNDYISVGTAAIFTFLGSYVMIGVSVWKEALGFAFMPYIFYLYFSEKKSFKILGLVSLLVMPLVHHYVTVITYTTMSYMLIFEINRKIRAHETIMKNIILLAYVSILWIYMILYYSMFNFNRLEIISITSNAWLILSIFVIFTLLGIKIINTEKRLKLEILKFFAVLTAIAFIFLVAILVPLFPDVITLRKGLIFMYGYFFILPLATCGGIIISRSSWEYKSFYVAILLSPLTFITFSLLMSYDVLSFVMLFRTFDFLDFCIALSTLTGIVYISEKINKYKPKISYVREIMLSAMIITLSLSTPLYANSYQVFEVENYVEDWTSNAIKYLVVNKIYNYSSDVYIFELGRNLYDLQGNFTLPYFLLYNYSVREDYVVVSEKWLQAAQLYPEKSISIDRKTLSSLLVENDVIYVSGPPGRKVYVIRISSDRA